MRHGLRRTVCIVAPLMFWSPGILSAKTIMVGTGSTDYFADIQGGIDAATNGDTVVVTDGTYSGPGNREIDFRGKAITVRSANGPEHCRIDCERKSSAFLFHSGEEVTAVLDGFTITGGYTGRGAGVCCTDNSSPTIIRCVFRDNEADRGGGGVYTSGSNLVLAQCTFIGNRATFHRVCSDEGCRTTAAYGGAVLSESSKPTITDCNFCENLALGYGGAVCSVHSTVSFANCVFLSNDANESGGGICNMDDSTISLLDCTLIGNRADNDGGGLAIMESKTTVSRCAFTANFARRDDGGAVANMQGKLAMDNCLFQDNQADEDGGALADFDSNSVANDCVFSGNSANEDGGAIYAWETVIRLSGCSFIDNTAGDDGGAIHNHATKTVSLVTCRFTGNHARDNGGAIFNRYGVDPQLFHCVFSDNMARSTGGAMYNRGSCNPVLTNCLLVGNAANDAGGALCNRDNSDPTLVNCTISDNTATFECGGILSWDDCRPALTNCILWGNRNEGGSLQQAHISGGEPIIKSCCIQASDCSLAGTGSIIDDPLFVAGPLGGYYLSHVEAGQTSTSPCCDAGVAPPKGMNPLGFTTRTDHVEDSGAVDMGYHYPVLIPTEFDTLDPL